MLFKEIIAVYSDNHTKPMNTKYTVTDFKIAGIYIGFKGLKKETGHIQRASCYCHM
jgi:hypothetical protein